MKQTHAFVIVADREEGIAVARTWVADELGIRGLQHPDVSVFSHDLFSVADARRIAEIASGAAFVGDSTVIIITASRMYHEAQNALLKVFEEPQPGTYLFLIIPTLGGLLPTLRSRVQIMPARAGVTPERSPVADTFLAGSREKRLDIIKRLTSGKDEEKRREQRDAAIALMNAVEAVVHAVHGQKESDRALLRDIAVLRPYLYERSAPVRMILEHLAIIIPNDIAARTALVY